VVTIYTTMYNIKKFYVLFTQIIYVIFTNLGVNSDFFSCTGLTVLFCNWDTMCLLRGTSWIFKICKLEQPNELSFWRLLKLRVSNQVGHLQGKVLCTKQINAVHIAFCEYWDLSHQIFGYIKTLWVKILITSQQ
jgi:hypothetical protein